MKYRYFAGPSGGDIQEIDPLKVDKFFEIVKDLTGLDRAMAESILHRQGSIRHPTFVIRSEVDTRNPKPKSRNPFEPVKIV
jgi:hypothetical protein